ncbi:MAG: type IV pilus secretin PilQ [Acidiferrobacterales bacterium]
MTKLQGAGANGPLNLIKLLLLAASLCLSAAATAAEMTGISWESGGSSPALQVHISGKSSYEVASLEGGQRLRVSFPKIKLGSAVTDLDGRGPVKGVYPYLADNGTAVYVDLLMTDPGHLMVEATKYGYRVVAAKGTSTATSTPAPAAVAPAPVEAAGAAPVAAAVPVPSASPVSTPAAGVSGKNVIQAINYVKLPGDRVQIRIQMARAPGKPAAFTTNNPATISLDFANTRVGLDKDSLSVLLGVVHRVTAIEAEHRTRVIVSLVRPAGYSTSISGNTFVMTIDNPTTTISSGPAVATTHFANAVGTEKHSLKKIDFRRGPQGDGKVIVGLSDTGVGIDLREEAGKITVDFLNTRITPELQRRLDVTDFATPIQSIDTYQQGRNVRMIISASGKYDHLAYQAGDVFTVNVKPVVTAPGQENKVQAGGYTGQKLSLNFQNIDVRAALQVIADFTGLNFVTSDSVKGNLTLRLKDVPWDQALDIILDAKNLAMERNGNVISVAPAAEIAAKQKASLEASKVQQELEPLVSELIQINYSKAADIAKLLKSIKAVNPAGQQQSPASGSVTYQKLATESNSLLSPRGQVTVDERTNSILIQDTPSKIREVRKLIAQLDKPVRQVMIETRLVEATDDFAKNLGVRLGVRSQTTNATACGTLDCNAAALTTGSAVNLTGNALNVNMSAGAINTTNPGSIALTLLNLPNSNLLDLELSALQQEGRGKIISSPRIITANQKKARIEQGQERTFTALGGGLGTQSFLTKNAVLALEVTPQITPDDRVILDVLITKDDFQSASATDSTMNKKEITTQVLLDNGETVVIGGIYEQTQNTVLSKVPFFGDLPLLGWMFRSTSELNNRDELLIFLTPRILSDNLAVR